MLILLVPVVHYYYRFDIILEQVEIDAIRLLYCPKMMNAHTAEKCSTATFFFLCMCVLSSMPSRTETLMLIHNTMCCEYFFRHSLYALFGIALDMVIALCWDALVL